MKLLISLVSAVLFLLIFSGVHAGGSVVSMVPGEKVEYRCKGGTIQFNPSSGSTIAWKCVGSSQPPPDKPPSGKCARPVSSSQKLQIGQEAPILLTRPANRHFCSTNYPRGTNISWGQYSASSFSALTVIVSETANNTDRRSVDRACFRGGQNDQMNVGFSSGCPIKPNTLYYVSITAKHPTTGKPTGSGARQIALFNAKK